MAASSSPIKPTNSLSRGPFPEKARLITGRSSLRERMLVHPIAGRDAHPPCAIEVPYTTMGFSFNFGIKEKEAESGTPISIHVTLLYTGRKSLYSYPFLWHLLSARSP